MRACWIMIMALGGGLTGPVSGQGVAVEGPIYPEILQEDLEAIRTFIHEVHPDPYRFTSRERLDAVVDSVRRAIQVPLTRAAFAEAVLPVFHVVGDPKLRIEVPHSNGDSGKPLLPLRVRVIEGGIYVEEELKGFRSLPRGAQILSINGLAAEKILEKLARYVVTEGTNDTRRLRVIEAEFASLYARYIDANGDHVIRFQSPNGQVEEQRIKGMTAEEMARSRKPQGKALAPWSGVPVQDAGVLWLTLRTLDRDSLLGAKQKPEKYLASLLKELRRSKTQTLVLDVRGAGGRELAMAELVFGVIARTPFRVVQDMTVRSVEPPSRYQLAAPMPDYYAMVREQFMPTPTGGAHLRPDDLRLCQISPAPKAFEGAVYVVCDGLTRDAAAALVMLVKREQRGRVIGEEVGTNAASFTGGREMRMTTPNARLRMHIPLMRYVPEGSPTGPFDRGELPHHEVQPQVSGVAKGRDTVRESVLQLLLELR